MAQKTHIANTASSTAMTWNEFASNVNNGTTYEGITVYLDENITATTRVGSGETKCFKGTFDGQGHTITFTFNSSAQYAAPFAYVEAATFQNLKVTGTITTNFMCAGGFVGRNVTGNTTFINCESNVTINSSYSGDTVSGGFVGSNNGMVTFDGCAFTGRLLGSASYAIGGFVGWTLKNSGTGVQFTNCVFAPTEITVDLAAGGTFARYNSSYSTASFTNCYYTQTLGTAQGKQRYTITGQSPVIVAMDGTATTYNVSHITAYSGTPGLLYNGTIIAGEGDPVILNLDGYDIGYVADHGTLMGNSNPYTLIMETNNTVISAEPCPPPTDLTVAGTTATTATLQWSVNGAPTAWQICLNDDETNLIEADSNPFTLTGLTPDLFYTAKVRANCGDALSYWSSSVTFTTLEVCHKPTTSYGYNGFTDDLTTLLPEDDAATANWGSDWRMPTNAEFEELYNNTTVTWTQQNGVNGRLFTASNGNSLFLPAAGYRWVSELYNAGSYGYYWSRSLYTDYPSHAWTLGFYSDYCGMGYSDRVFGFSVRPVREN